MLSLKLPSHDFTCNVKYFIGSSMILLHEREYEMAGQSCVSVLHLLLCLCQPHLPIRCSYPWITAKVVISDNLCNKGLSIFSVRLSKFQNQQIVIAINLNKLSFDRFLLYSAQKTHRFYVNLIKQAISSTFPGCL